MSQIRPTLDRIALVRAARYLDDAAQCAFNGGTVYGKWVKDDAYCATLKKEHDEQMALAKQLRRMAGRLYRKAVKPKEK